MSDREERDREERERKEEIFGIYGGDRRSDGGWIGVGLSPSVIPFLIRDVYSPPLASIGPFLFLSCGLQCYYAMEWQSYTLYET